MSNLEAPGLARARELVSHRLAGHRAALEHAHALGWPHILADAVAETRAAADECAAILDAIDAAFLTGPHPAEGKPAACVSPDRARPTTNNRT